MTTYTKVWIAVGIATLAIERLWLALWPLILYGCVVGAVLLSGAMETLPLAVHRGAVIAAAIGFLALGFLRLKAFKFPKRSQAVRLIESSLVARPLTTLEDTLANQTPFSLTLWNRHREQARKRIGRLRTRFPCPPIGAEDPFGLRFLGLIALLIAAVTAQESWSARLGSGLFPSSPELAIQTAVLITPPEYSGHSPFYLFPDQKERLSVPEESELLVRVSGTRSPPTLELDQRRFPLEALEDEHYQRVLTLTQPLTKIKVKTARETLASWDVDLIVDQPPWIEHADAPQSTAYQALAIGFQAGDDYGVSNIVAKITAPEIEGSYSEIVLPLASNLQAKTIARTSYHDLTPHPLAGETVHLRLEASDHKGQTTATPALAIILPERAFSHPIAKELVEIRKKLLRLRISSQEAARRLETILDQEWTHRVGSYLALSVAYHWLNRHPVEGRERVPDLLWKVALALEDGDLSLALEQLRTIQKQLEQALEGDASEEDLKRLTQKLQEALERYLRALASQEQTNDLAASRQTVESADLDRMMESLSDLIEVGAREQAMRMLSELQNILENLRSPTSGENFLHNALKNLQEIIKQQQSLIDQTFEESKRPEQSDQARLNSLARQQNILRHELEAFQQLFDYLPFDQPPSLDQANQTMLEAGKSLPDPEALDRSLDSQQMALGHLLEGMERFIETLDGAFSGGGMRPGFGYSPDDPNRWELPDAASLTRAKEILDILRERSSDSTRPIFEREYFERLLKRF